MEIWACNMVEIGRGQKLSVIHIIGRLLATLERLMHLVRVLRVPLLPTRLLLLLIVLEVSLNLASLYVIIVQLLPTHFLF